MKLPLFIQYNNSDITDGVGAQALRILGIYGIANHLKLGYLHQRIIKLTYQEELSGPEPSSESFEDLLDQVNRLFTLPSHKIPKNTICFNLYSRNLGRKMLLAVIVLSLLLLIFRIRIILNVTLPFGVSDKFKNPYEIATNFVLANIPHSHMRSTPRNVLHYRTIVHTKDAADRKILSCDYYRETVVDFAYRNGMNHLDLVVHCDIEPEALKNSHNPRIIDFLNFCESVKHLGIEIKPYAPFFETFYDMVFAEHLFISKSAFSYLAGALNRNTVIYPPEYRHPKLPGWELGHGNPNNLSI